jgi:hypothetical protein
VNRDLCRVLLGAWLACPSATPAHAAARAESASDISPQPKRYAADYLPEPIPYDRPSPAAPLGIARSAETPAVTAIPKTGDFAVDIADRQHSGAFFNSVCAVAEGTPVGFTGDVSACLPGGTAAGFKDATLLRINYFREMVGVPDNIAFDPTYGAKAQRAALMMARADALSHHPTPTWPCYTADGAEGASNSNLALGSNG